MGHFLTKNLPDDRTYTGRVKPSDLTPKERHLILEGDLGYCEAHRVLYRKYALHSCVVPLVIAGARLGDCKEWGT